MIITIDGPAGVGKSTVAKLVAQKLNFSYFDTGAMYRAVTYALLKNNINPDDEKSVLDFLKNHFKYEIKKDQGQFLYFVNDEDVSGIIRSNHISNVVSQVSTKEYIRKTLLPFQRKYADDNDLVAEGRDMGTVIYPNAKVKIYLTARASVRAERRFQELTEKFPQDIATLDKQEILEEIKIRDERDSTRKISPLRKAKGAHAIDTSSLSIDQVVRKIIKKVKKANKTTLLYRFVRFLAKFIMSTFYNLKVYGKENITKKAAIITSNHTSFFDPPVLAAAMKEEIHFLAKEPLFKIIILKSIIKRLNAHPISFKESNVKTFRIVDSVLKEGKKIVIFPEGTRTDGSSIEELLPGVAFLVNLTKCDIMPVCIYGADKVWGRNKKFPKLFGKISCVFGKPIKFEEFEHLPKEEKIKTILDRITTSLENLKAYADAGFVGPIP
ncbi:MAG: (d)CMP kinase [Parachlamydiales bacterium]|nr:(d)CMP kinase [Parachlamydiales bacterium]